MSSGTYKRGSFASPPCALPDVDGITGNAADDVKAWRNQERLRLVGLRRSIETAERRALDARIADGLDSVLPKSGSTVVAVYWPIRGEPDLRDWYANAVSRGIKLALPVVTGKDQPLAFLPWCPGDALVPGALKIPVPADGEPVRPDVIVSPLVGFDEDCHRLGNGGGYYDRTLASYETKPLTIGVGYQRCALRTIYPQSFDVPMDCIITEDAITPEHCSRDRV